MTGKEFESIAKGIRKDLVRLAGRFSVASGMAEEPEDIAQEALTALWELSQSGYPIRAPKALAIKITKNICIARYRKRKIETLPINEDILDAGSPATTTTPDMEDIQRIKDTLYSQLTKTQREYMSLRSDSGMTLDEIASVTGRPKSSIKVTISNARKQLSDRLKKIL